MNYLMSRRLPALSLALLLVGGSAAYAGPSRQVVDADAPNDVVGIPLEESGVQRFPAPEGASLADGGVPASPLIEYAVDDADDPPALLTDETLGGIRALASDLSADASWLREEVIRVLAGQDLRLDEVFVDAPEFVTIGDETFRIQLELSGQGWADFDPETDDYTVFLSHEIYDGLGDASALAFVDGEETALFDFEVETTRAIAVTLADVLPGERTATLRTAAVADSIALGSAELRMTAERLPVHLFPEIAQAARIGQRFSLDSLAAMVQTHEASAAGLADPTGENSTCIQEVAPTSCSGTTIQCGAGYTPYFVMTQLKIKQDHEGLFKGSPEIELFPMRIDIASPLGSNTTATTPYLFSGRNVTDVSGRTRYLPDVNNVGSWYTVTNGVSIFPANNGTEFSAMLVEQDDDAGVLRVKSTKINVTKLFERIGTVVSYIVDARKIDENFLVAVFNIVKDIIGLFDDGDDIFQESIGVANSLVCDDSLGQMKTYTLLSQEWEMKGHFACVNPTCPDPGSGGGGGGGGGGWPGGGCLYGTETCQIP